MTQSVGAAVVRSHAVADAERAAAGANAANAAYHLRDRFIPVSRRALLHGLTLRELWPGFDAADVRICFDLMANWRHLAYADREQDLIEAYLPFNPDRDIADAAIAGYGHGEGDKAKFVALVQAMLERANYDEIARANLQTVIDEYNPYGLELDVNLDEFEDILVFVRGEGTDEVEPDLVSRLRGKKPITVTVFHRVFLLFTLKSQEARAREIMIEERVSEAKALKMVARQRKMLPPEVDETHIYVKMFKDVPRPDLEIMFPNTRVKLRHTDKLTIGASAGGGIGMGVVSAATKIVAAALTPIGAALAVLGLAGAASQQVAQVMHRRARYMLKVTRNLYFQNISNNQGALSLLTSRAEEEDIKEEWLLYALLAKTSVHRGELSEAQAAIEEFLADHFKVHVAFDTDDALDRLMTTGLVVEQADGVLVAMSPATVARHITALWHDHLDHIAEKDRQVAKT